MLVAKYHESNCQEKEILASIQKSIDSSLQLRSKNELIENFIGRINVDSNVDDDWRAFVKQQKEDDILEIINSEKLKEDETRKYMDNAFRDRTLKTTGTDIDKIMPPVSRFGGGRETKKQTVIEKLQGFFEKYFGLGGVGDLTDDGSVIYEYPSDTAIAAEKPKDYKYID